MSSDTGEPTTHRQSSPDYDIVGDLILLPVGHGQVRDLLGRLLTQLDALGLQDRAHRAARSLITQDVWRWWDSVHENATTSYQGCIAPIVMSRTGWSADETPPTEPASNRWGWPSEQAWLESRTAASNGATEAAKADAAVRAGVSGRVA